MAINNARCVQLLKENTLYECDSGHGNLLS